MENISLIELFDQSPEKLKFLARPAILLIIVYLRGWRRVQLVKYW